MDAYKGGYVVLTSQRLIWMDGGPEGRSCWIHVRRWSTRMGGAALHALLFLIRCSILEARRKNQIKISGLKVRVELDVAANHANKAVEGEVQVPRS